MVDMAALDPQARALFLELSRSTGSEPEAQASMYALGATIGLDRDASARAAEDLIAQGLVEIRTLSGDIGLSQAGADALSDHRAKAGPPSPRLGTDSPLDAPRREHVDQLLTGLKHDLGRSGLAFEALAEIAADIRTIEAQMASPRPKTGIVRECFQSLLKTAGEHRQTEWQRRLEAFLA